MRQGRYESNGTVEYFKDDKLHREDGPAMIDADGYKVWFVNGLRHRLDGPAVLGPDGHQAWYVEGQLHREDGPALILKTGTREWFIHDKRITEQEFNQYLKAKELCTDKTPPQEQEKIPAPFNTQLQTKLAALKCLRSDKQSKTIER
ncbi:hypothetical protein [Burkholderia metallica]|uniref:hypothetical protein n=1 Tax=Burkholderia metallica TaxID=488729 RepID=UPI00158F60E0|nr:hypothetical protein [Burkholderia metallica]